MLARLAALVVLSSLLTGCLVIEANPWDSQKGGAGVKSHGLVHGHATAGWPAEKSIVRLGIFDGPNPGTLLHLTIWKLLRAEIGFLGASLGVGPLDAGFGVLLYEPAPPPYCNDVEAANIEDDADD